MADPEMDFTCPPATVLAQPLHKLPKAAQATLAALRSQLDTGNNWGSIDACARRILAIHVPQPIIDRAPNWVQAALRELRSEMNGDLDFAAAMVYAAEHEQLSADRRPIPSASLAQPESSDEKPLQASLESV